MNKCKFVKAWQGKCNAPTVEDSLYCKEHNGEACCVCGEQATHDCSETFQFVCGFPLCDKEECKIKHHPMKFQLKATRWAEVYQTALPQTLKNNVGVISYNVFKEHVLRDVIVDFTSAVVELTEGVPIEGVRSVTSLGTSLYVRMENGMMIKFAPEI